MSHESLVTTPPSFPEVSEGDWKTTASGLGYLVARPGNGVPASEGQQVKCHYCGWLTDGTKFDASYDRGDAFGFKLGAGQVIKGWDEGLQLMCVGDVYFLKLPAELGYGAAGAGGLIPGGATLIFQVELLEAEY